MGNARLTRSSQSLEIPAAMNASQTMKAVAPAVLSELLLAGAVGLTPADVEPRYPGYWYPPYGQ